MRRSYLLLLLFISFGAIGAKPVTAQGYRGRDFWICFPQNAIQESNRGLDLSLVISAEDRAAGEIENMTDSSRQHFSVESRAMISLPVDTLLESRNSGKFERKSLHIVSDRDISVFVVSHRPSSTDSYVAIPTAHLGTDYVVAGYRSFNHGTFASEFCIVGTEDTSMVTIRLAADTRDSLPAGRTLTMFLRKGETLQFEGTNRNSTNDLTGTTISSDKPIAVVSGSVCAQVPADTRYCDMLMEEEVPTKDLGREFVLTTLGAKRSYGMRVIASHDSTEVIIDGVRVAYLDRGGYYSVDTLQHDLLVRTSQPALVGEYCTSVEADSTAIGEPFMFFISPTDRFTNEYTSASVTVGPYRHFINAVIPRKALPTFSVDGVRKFPKGETSLEDALYDQNDPFSVRYKQVRPVFGSEFVAVSLEVMAGRHLIECDEPMAVYSYGFGLGLMSYDSYGHNCGMRLDAQ